jgi:hypothetical protein
LSYEVDTKDHTCRVCTSSFSVTGNDESPLPSQPGMRNIWNLTNALHSTNGLQPFID